MTDLKSDILAASDGQLVRALVQLPITAGSWAQAAANVQTVMDIIAVEGSDGNDAYRGFFDSMSPAARLLLYRQLLSLKVRMTAS